MFMEGNSLDKLVNGTRVIILKPVIIKYFKAHEFLIEKHVI